MSIHLATPEHDQLVQASWSRCRGFGLQQASLPDFDGLSTQALAQLLERQHDLVHTTHREVLPYYENILGHSNCLIRLADPQGRMLKSWGDQRFIEAGRLAGFDAGACWLEQRVGTNAIGTALACQQAVHIEHDEHYLRANRFMTGSAAPIFDAQRQVVAVLDVSSDSYLPPSHTLGLVKVMSQTVENRLILNAFGNSQYQLTFNTGLNNLDSQWAGLLIFNEGGQVLAANRRADSLLGGRLLGRTLESVFNTPLSDLLDQPGSTPFALLAAGRSRFQCLLRHPLRTPLRPATATATVGRQANQAPACDERVERALRQGGRLLEKNIPLLITGETGTGKEVLVKALHRASSRAHQPLVAVNCAAIPAELVESELFGYERGAFTGANQKGNPGLIRKADKGILFLDEIGDLPMSAQARLLRVLQERCIQPLGSGDPWPVDIRVVCATHQDLRERVSAGLFRQDLYYRVAGVTLQLPALRERSDRQELIQQLWQQYREPEQAAGLTLEVLGLMLQHPWPGNIRQLASVMQVALALAEQEPVGVEHLPADFYQDLPQAPAPVVVPITPIASADLNELLVATQGNISQLARRLGVSRNTLYKRLRAEGLG